VKLFKHCTRTLVHHIANLFNHVVRSGFPLSWSHHIIHSIHKSRSSADPNNYRMIMVGHVLEVLCHYPSFVAN
jgi:hypothetical protein